MSRPSRYASRGRRDANHVELANVYALAGWLVEDLSMVGGGVGDTLVRDKRGRIHAREFKTVKGTVEPHQQDWLDLWGGKVIRSVDEALDDIRKHR